MTRLGAIALAGALLAATGAHGQEPSELDRIPREADAPPPVPAGDASRRFLVEDAVSVTRADGDANTAWLNRASVDLSGEAAISEALRLAGSHRLSLLSSRDLSPGDRGSVRYDVREVLLDWTPERGQTWRAGRINLRNGVALGFNPTDFFRRGSGVVEASNDPTVLKAGRLGAVMVDVQGALGPATLGVTWSPRLGQRRSDLRPRSALDLSLDRTNETDRGLVTLSFPLADLNPQVLVLVDEPGVVAGFNVSHLLSPGVVGYLEWSGGRQPSVLERAVARSAELGFVAPAGFPRGDGSDFLQALAVGFSWSHAEAKTTLNLEYHLNGGGLSSRQWRAFAAARDASVPPDARAFASTLILTAASDQQPLGRRHVFVRLARADLFARDLDVSVFVLANVHDRSWVAEASATYPLSDRLSLTTFVSRADGNAGSEYGRGATAATLQLTRYF